MLKRIIAALMSLILILGCGLNVYGSSPEPGSWHIVSQPTGETFRVYLTVSAVVYPGVIGQVEINDKLRYTVILAEDGYWYYYEIKQIIQYRSSDNKENPFIITTNEEFEQYRNSESLGSGGYVEYYNRTKYLIDPLPNKVQSYNMEYRFNYTETTEEEKAEMDELIQAERRRLGKTETTVPSYESPGPDCFITEPPEPVEPVVSVQPSTSVIEPLEATESAADTESNIRTDGSSQAAVPVIDTPDSGNYVPILLLLCGGFVVLAGGAVIVLWLGKRRANRNMVGK